MTNESVSAKINLSKLKEVLMKKFLKKFIIMSLLGGLILAVGKGGTNKPKPMNEIDPGPANAYIK